MNGNSDDSKAQPTLIDPDRKAAHLLWTELYTRVATRPLPYRSGTESGALDSLYKLSQELRKQIAEHPEAHRYRPLALEVLAVLTEHLSRWHPRREANGPLRLQQDRHLYRGELIELQAKLSGLADQLHQICHQGECPKHVRVVETETLPGLPPKVLSATEDTEPPLGAKTAEKALQHEFAHLGIQDTPQVCGLALSGGGIRSATFALGILQGLQAQGMLQQFHYLSTVSGGGYLGGYLSGGIARLMFSPVSPPASDSQDEPAQTAHGKDPAAQSEQNASNEPYAREKVFDGLGTPERDWVRWLRNNSKYLLNVRYRIPRIASILLYGLFENTLTLIGLGMLAGLIIAAVADTGFVQTVAAILASSVMIYVAVRPVLPPRLRERWYLDRYAIGFACGVPLLLSIEGIDFLAEHLNQNLEKLTWPAAGFGAFSSLFAMAYAASQAHPNLGKWLRPTLLNLIALILGPALFLIVAILTHSLSSGHWPAAWGAQALPQSEHVMVGILAAIVTVILVRACFVDVNHGGLRSYYRSRLRSCYGVMPPPGDSQRDLALTQLPKRPFHIINTALNAPASGDPELRGRGCDFFSVTPMHCGSRLTGYKDTSTICEQDPHFDLATAIATSGAAASSLMGRQSKAQFQFLMTLFNVRLGYWLRWATNNPWLRPNAFYLVREALGLVHEKGNFINLSDGGHIENLAVYELLRRRVQFIVCIDGGCDPSMSCFDLIRLDRYARIDLNVKLHYELKDLTPNAEGLCPSYGTMVRIEYGPNETGWMLYCKLAMTGTESQVIHDYRKTSPTFPHETTSDQFFDEEQFEAYRLLGETAAKHFFGEAFGRYQPKAGDPSGPLPLWLRGLAMALGVPRSEEPTARN